MVKFAMVSNLKHEPFERGVNKFLEESRKTSLEIKETMFSGSPYEGFAMGFFYDDGEKPKKSKTVNINED